MASETKENIAEGFTSKPAWVLDACSALASHSAAASELCYWSAFGT